MVPTAFALTVVDIIPLKPGSRLHQDGQWLDINALTEDVYVLIRQRGEILLTSTVIGKLYAIRVVAANQKSDEQQVHEICNQSRCNGGGAQTATCSQWWALNRQLRQSVIFFNGSLLEIA